ncbi:hypothetical protein FGB62_60g013 [Gracilaria domingensis]|nr:hypothetical protein FGB62_60g013 [Gracilaria domingensis]
MVALAERPVHARLSNASPGSEARGNRAFGGGADAMRRAVPSRGGHDAEEKLTGGEAVNQTISSEHGRQADLVTPSGIISRASPSLIPSDSAAA